MIPLPRQPQINSQFAFFFCNDSLTIVNLRAGSVRSDAKHGKVRSRPSALLHHQETENMRGNSEKTFQFSTAKHAKHFKKKT
jgi:hypothetical protein